MTLQIHHKNSIGQTNHIYMYVCIHICRWGQLGVYKYIHMVVLESNGGE